MDKEKLIQSLAEDMKKLPCEDIYLVAAVVYECLRFLP